MSVALYYTRCPVPTASGIAFQRRMFDPVFRGTAYEVRDLRELGPDHRNAHYIHSIRHFFREGGGAPPVWARSRGVDSVLLGITFMEETLGIFVRADDPAVTIPDLAGKRFALPLWPRLVFNFWRFAALKGIVSALRVHSMSVRDIRLVDVTEDWDPHERRDVQRRDAPAAPRCEYRNQLRALRDGRVDALFGKGPEAALLERDFPLRDWVAAEPLAEARRREEEAPQATGRAPRTQSMTSSLTCRRAGQRLVPMYPAQNPGDMTSNKPATEALWKAMAPTFERIMEHPFITGLADGSLPKDTFAGYLIQDYFYLEEYGRCWALLGAQSPEIEDLVTFTGKIGDSLAYEQQTQQELLEALGYDRGEMLAETEPSPTCVGFTSFIKNACATRAWHDGFVSVLECPWAYWEVGKVLNVRGSPDPLYQKWIESYLTEGFEEACERLHFVWERVAADLGPVALRSAAYHAHTAIRYDWMFWDAAYRREQWAV